jgi:hypothetical protein
MMCKFPGTLALTGILLLSPAARAQPDIDLAPGDDDPAEPTAEPVDLTRGLQEERFRRAHKTSIGGYGELHYNRFHPEGQDSSAMLDLHRLVLFVAHNFTEQIRFYTEIEVEHAYVSTGRAGEVGVEQAFVDWQFSESVGLRAGIVLVPMGIINQWHEPPVFNGVERPAFARSIIPSTWREGGIGLFGKPAEEMSYELYLVGGLDPLRFSASTGLRGGRQAVAEARADSLALTGRFEWEPRLATVAGASFYAGTAGGNADLFDDTGAPLELSVPVLGGALDVRTRIGAIEARAEIAGFAIGDTARLRDARDRTGMTVIGPDAPSRILGGYLEAGYDLLSLARRGPHQLIAFARFERNDTMYRVDGRARTPADDARGINDYVVGLTYRPIPALVFKGDVIFRRPDGDGGDNTILNLGVGYMF